MKKLFKVIVILFAVLVVLLIGATVALRLLYPPERLKSVVTAQAESQLHRKLEIGDVSVGLIGGLSVRSVKLSEKPDFSAGTFVSADDFSIRPQLLPLLHGKLVVSKILLSDAKISVVQHADGTFNFSDLTGAPAKPAAPAPKPAARKAAKPAPAPAAAPPSSGAGFAFVFSDAELRRAAVDYTGPGVKAALLVSDARVQGVKPSGSF